MRTILESEIREYCVESDAGKLARRRELLGAANHPMAALPLFEVCRALYHGARDGTLTPARFRACWSELSRFCAERVEGGFACPLVSDVEDEGWSKALLDTEGDEQVQRFHAAYAVRINDLQKEYEGSTPWECDPLPDLPQVQRPFHGKDLVLDTDALLRILSALSHDPDLTRWDDAVHSAIRERLHPSRGSTDMATEGRLIVPSSVLEEVDRVARQAGDEAMLGALRKILDLRLGKPWNHFDVTGITLETVAALCVLLERFQQESIESRGWPDFKDLVVLAFGLAEGASVISAKWDQQEDWKAVARSFPNLTEQGLGSGRGRGATLRRLKIWKFRHVAPETELQFQPGLNVLLGRNASGKSTLLDLAAAVLRGDFTTFDEDFEVEFEVEAKGSRIRGSVSRTREGDSARIEMSAAAYDSRGAFVAEFAVENGWLSVARNGRTEREPIQEKFWLRLFWHVTRAIWRDDRERPDYGHRECHRFDESLRLFESMCGTADRGPETLVRVVLRDDAAPQVEGTYLPTSMRDMFGDVPNSPNDDIRITHERLPFLAEAVARLGFARGTWSASLITRNHHEDSTILHYNRFSFGFERPDGTYLTESLLSYGQKRLLAFLYYLHANEGPVVADEVVNGLHHEWIKNLVERMATRQAFLSTQNPLLLDYLNFESPEDVRRTFVFCETEKDTSGIEQMTWRHLSEDDARAFFDAYEVGIQHVSELLRTRGLW